MSKWNLRNKNGAFIVSIEGATFEEILDKTQDWINSNPDSVDGLYVKDEYDGVSYELIRDGNGWNIKVDDGEPTFPPGSLEEVANLWLQVAGDWGDWEENSNMGEEYLPHHFAILAYR